MKTMNYTHDMFYITIKLSKGQGKGDVYGEIFRECISTVTIWYEYKN